MRTNWRRDPWQFFWRLATGDIPLAVTLFGLAGYLVVLTLVPQLPTDPLATDRWLAEAQTRFGAATETLYQIGLFSLTDSPLPRILLSILAFLLVVRAIGKIETLWRDRPPWSSLQTWGELSSILAHIAPLLLLVGLMVGSLWGWRAEGLTGQAGDTLTVAEHGEIALVETASGIRSIQAGVSVYVSGNGPQLSFQAVGDEGVPLGLQLTPQEPTASELSAALTADTPEAFFAIPEAELVVRASLSPSTDLTAASPIVIQVFRTPRGELVEEVTLTEDERTLSIDGTRLSIQRSPYLILTAIRDPGRWLKAAGLILGAVGLLGALSRPSRQQYRWKALPTVFHTLLVSSTLFVAGAALQRLIVTGTLGDRQAAHTGPAVLWLILCAIGLILFRPNLDKGDEEA